jgi:regulator of sigma E protease
VVQFPLPQAMVYAAREVRIQFEMTTSILWQLFKNLITFNKQGVSSDVEKLSGPVGAMKIFVMITQWWVLSQYFLFLALISLALGIFNLLPIPALDGGRLLGVILQTLTRSPKETFFHIEWYINMFFFVLMMALGLFLIVKDFGRFWWLSLW